MKGVIFNLLESYIAENLGEEELEKILSEAPLKTKEPFVGPKTYPDEDLSAIIATASRISGITEQEIVRRFGRFCFPELAEKYPLFIEPHRHPKPFLKSVNSIIHVEVKKLYLDAKPPEFTYEDPSEDRLIIKYTSKRRLCQFMEGMIEGVGNFFNYPVKYTQRTCMLENAPACEFHLVFSPEEGPPQ